MARSYPACTTGVHPSTALCLSLPMLRLSFVNAIHWDMINYKLQPSNEQSKVFKY